MKNKEIIVKYQRPNIADAMLKATDKIAYSPSYKRKYVYAKKEEDLPVLEEPVKWLKIGERYFRGVKYNKYIFSYPQGFLMNTLIKSYQQSTPLLAQLTLEKDNGKTIS